jgi:hypothetical protein
MGTALSTLRSNNPPKPTSLYPAKLSLAIFAVLSSLAGSPQAQLQAKQAKRAPIALVQGDLLVEVAAGDTLIDLAYRELAYPHDWRSLAKLNGLTNPLAVPLGFKVFIPKSWRKPIFTKATVVSLEGPVSTKQGALKVGASLTESDQIQTGTNAVVVLQLPDGSTVRIPPGSQVRIDRLRGYHGSEAIEARLNLEQGGVEVQSESSRLGRAPTPGRVIEVVTPKATASVRGTSFRIGADGDRSVAEILNGSIEWAGTSERRALPGGFGVAVDKVGLGPTEKLLPASGKLLSDIPLEKVEDEVEFQTVAGADKYLLEVATDPTFNALVSSTVQTTSKAVVRSERDGPHYLKVRAIAPSGVAGYDASFSLNVAARPIAPPVVSTEPAGINFGPQTMFGWAPVVQANRYRIQVAGDETFKNILSDERAESPRSYFGPKEKLSDLTTYFWRVASLDSDKQGPWGNIRKIEFAPVMGGVTPQIQGDSVAFEWNGQPEQNFETQLARNLAFSDLVVAKQVKGVSWKLDSLPPGQYQMRVRQIFSNGSKGPYTAALAIDIPAFLRDGSGQPMRSGTGELLVIPR